MEDKLVTVAEFMNSIQAEMTKQVLEDCGIKVILLGQNVGDGRIGVFETVKLQVQQSRADEARQVIEDLEEGQEQGREPEDYEVMDESEDVDEPYEPDEQEEH
jgi:predicted Fe-Mo cluster-binding NifX family protein